VTVKGPGRRELRSEHVHVPIRNFIEEKSGFGGMGSQGTKETTKWFHNWKISLQMSALRRQALSSFSQRAGGFLQ
jgi:hypothetical protein